jgi:hypothetical protein
MIETISAILFTFLTGVIIVFQLCLAMGMPWGAASMGGKFPGKYPTKMRIVAIINSIVLLFIAIIVLSGAGLLLLQINKFSKVAIWFIVLFFAIGTIMNTITKSKIERIWAPVAALQTITSFIVAIS